MKKKYISPETQTIILENCQHIMASSLTVEGEVEIGYGGGTSSYEEGEEEDWD